MSLIPLPAQLVIGAAVLGAAGWGIHHYGATRYAAGQSEVQARWDKQTAARTAAALKHETKTGQAEAAHAAATQENSDAFTTSQPVRDAIARADLARVERLRLDAERRAATYRAMSNSCTVAGISAADRLEALDRQLVSGVAVVGNLRKDLVRRDAEVVLLHGQIVADRNLVQPKD